MSDDSRPYRTKTGRVLTDTDIEALADEAERGYDIEQLAKRRGRPRMGSAPAVVVPVRLHPDLRSAVEALVVAERTSLSELVRDALRNYLARPTTPVEARTATGRLLTSADLDTLADEAETGYDMNSLRLRSSRRRRAEVIPVRMPPELKTEVERRADSESTSVSEIVRAALRARIDDDQSDPPGADAVRVFISHSSQDTGLVALVVDLFRSALNLPADTIRATSVDGYRLPAGAQFEKQLREELLSASAFVGILSPFSLSSSYVLFELGARWGAQKPVIPLLAPGMTAHALQGPIATLNALSCESSSQLHQLVQEVGAALGIQQESPAVYQAKIDAVAYYSIGGESPSTLAVGVTQDPDRTPRGISPSEGTHVGNASDDDYSDAEAVIRHHCQREWPEDFTMQAYCMNQQRQALVELRKGTPSDIPQEVFRQIRSRCAAEWPDDYSMRAYCESQQFAAYREIGLTKDR